MGSPWPMSMGRAPRASSRSSSVAWSAPPDGLQALDGEWIFDAETHQLYSPNRSINLESYTFDYVDVSYTPDALRNAGPVNSLTPARLTNVVEIDEMLGRGVSS